MVKLRIGVLLSGGGRTLTNILEHITGSDGLPVEVVVVIASRQCKGIEVARQAGIDTHLVSHKDSADVETYSALICERLDSAAVELVIQAGFLSMWHVPERYANRVMNIHPALLPDFGGKGMFGHHVHQAVLDAGAKTSGCTVHFVTNEYDAGPIIIQKTVAVLQDDTPEALAARVFSQECVAYTEAIKLFAEGRLQVEGDTVRIKP